MLYKKWASFFAFVVLMSVGLGTVSYAAEVGIEWVNHFHGRARDLMYSDDMAVGFYDKLGESRNWKKKFNWGDDLAWERDFRDKSRGGDDAVWIDNVDFAYFASHGGSWNKEHHGLFSSNKDKKYYYSGEMRLGDRDLEWIVIDTCESLNYSHNSWFYMWDQTFKGLHLLLGHNGFSYDSWWTRNHGKRFAQYLRNGDPVSRAWFRAINEDWFVNQYPAAMAAGRTRDNVWFVMDHDHIWGHGQTVSDPKPYWFALRFYKK